MTSVYTATTKSATASTTKRYTGLASGLDTDEIVKGMTSSTRNKIAKQLQDRQILSWKTDSYRSISKKLIAFSEKFISFSSSNNLFSEKFFENATITSKGSNAAAISATGSPDGLKGLSILSVDELASTANFMTTKNASKQEFSSGEMNFTDGGRTVNTLAGETINLKYDGKYYNVTIDKNFQGDTAGAIKIAFNDALNKVKLADGVTTLDTLVKIDASGNDITLSSTDATKLLSVVGGSGSSLKALGITAGASTEKAPITGKIETANMTEQIVFNDIIKNKSMTFDLNGIQKKIQFTDKKFNSVEEFRQHLQTELDNSFGANKINVGLNSSSNGLKFSTTDSTSILTFAGGDLGLTGNKGILNMEAKSSNRLRIDRPLSEVGSALGIADPTEVTDDKGNKIIGYKITVNGKNFTFSKDKAISEVINEINNSDAGINIKYLSTTDKFSVVATETGAQGKVDINDALGGGNLMSTLLGYNMDEFDKNAGLTKKLSELPGLMPNKDGKYVLSIDNKEFSFTPDQTMQNVINTINGDDVDAKVTIAYGAKKFTITDDGGDSTRKIQIGGNLKDVLLGTSYNAKSGTDAKLKVSYDGGPATTLIRSNNSFTLDGANITINSKFSSGDPITFTSKQNSDEILKGIKEMVTAYNEVVDLVNKEVSTKRDRKYSPLTAEQEDGMTESQVKDWNEKAKAGMLFGDSELQSLSTELRFAFSFAVPEVGNISDFGITTASAYKDNGKIVIDETKLKAAIEERPDDVKKLFTMPKSTAPGATDSDAGIMNRVKKLLDKYASTTGEKGSLIKLAGLENSITTMDSSLYKQMTSIDTKVTALKKTLTTQEDRYYSQFTALEKYISQMNAQSSWLTQQSK